MQIDFRIHYHTQWGQQLYIVGSIPELGAWDIEQAKPLQYTYDGHWRASLFLHDLPADVEYIYILKDENLGETQQEWGSPRRLSLALQSPRVVLEDTWRAQHHPENVFYSSTFSKALFKADVFHTNPVPFEEGKVKLRLQISAPRIEPGQQLCISGNVEALGNWTREQVVLMGNPRHPLWEVEVLVDPYRALEYKFGLYDTQRQQLIALEDRYNRVLAPDLLMLAGEASTIVVRDEYFEHPQGVWKGAGMAIPVFSLRSEKSLGCGEFKDIKKLADWMEQTGLKMIQVLPINDTMATGTWTDSYPYASISVYALHPMYLNLEALGGLNEFQLTQLAVERQKLNALPEVDYEAVTQFKLSMAREIFDQQYASIGQDAKYHSFLKQHESWLPSYAAFCYLRDKFGTVNFNEWGEYAEFSPSILEQLNMPWTESHRQINFYCFLQYHLDKQLRKAAKYTRKKGIALKGDIPIGIYRYSVDAWVNPQLYHMDGQAGAPPDPFSASGQNWGFPTYNWEEMAKDGYQWWRSRLQQLSRYFDAFRIDHILGFFRIWEIPIEHVQGLMGVFNPVQALRREDFLKAGISFDEKRFCEPYISEELIENTFGDHQNWVKEHFLSPAEAGRYQLQAVFDTQKKIEAFFQQEWAQPETFASESTEEEELGYGLGPTVSLSNETGIFSRMQALSPAERDSLRDGLYDLVSNCVVFRDKNPEVEGYHFRIFTDKTHSFKSLHVDVQEALMPMYYDYFYHSQEAFWEEKALQKLPALKEASEMLICGEDLGMVPERVPSVMRDLNMLSLEIQRMSKNPQTEFLQEEDIPYWSVCSPSTHDMSPIRLWWEEMKTKQRQRFYQNELGFRGRAPKQCEPYIALQMLYQHLEWPSMWAIFPLQDLLAFDEKLRSAYPDKERINIPANPQHYWRYRMHLNLEDLMEAQTFNEYLKDILEETGRI